MPTYQYKFNKPLQIASIISNEKWHRLQVHTLMQNIKQKQPSINAFLGARYSRSADSVIEIAKEIMESGADAAKKLEMIFQGYGHKSVGDMADLFVCIENVPMSLAHRIFYTQAVIAGQERSTRYQNFQEPNYIKLPAKICPDKSLREEYDRIILKQMQDYRDLLEPTKQALEDYFKPDKSNKGHLSALQARTFDTVRYFLPIGLETSLGAVMSARNWAELIGFLRASNQNIDRELAELLFTLLTGNKELKKLGYEPEADGLIRHTEANFSRNKSTEKIAKLLKKYTKHLPHKKISPDMHQGITVSSKHDAIEELLSNYALILNPLLKNRKIKITQNDLKTMSRILFEIHNHHNQIGPLGQSGAILVEGFGDYGAILKDINRHRSLERFFPIHENHLDIDAELDRSNRECYYLCDYLDIKPMAKLKSEYISRFNENYELIKSWKNKAKKLLDGGTRLEYTRYLLPHAHASKYKLYGSFDDWQYLIHLRTRNGGHISYRKAVYSWLKALNKKSNIWAGIEKKILPVDEKSREQFFDRS